MSMANAIRFYESKENLMLKNAGETANFVEFWTTLIGINHGKVLNLAMMKGFK